MMDQATEVSIIAPLQFLALRVVFDNLPLYCELDAYIGLLPLRILKRLLSYVSSPTTNNVMRMTQTTIDAQKKERDNCNIGTSNQSKLSKVKRYTHHQWCRSWYKVISTISRDHMEFCKVIGSYKNCKMIGLQRARRSLLSVSSSHISTRFNHEILAACKNIVFISLPQAFVTDEALKCISTLPRVEFVCCKDVNRCSPTGLHCLSTGACSRSIRALDLSGCSALSDGVMSTITTIPHLEWLNCESTTLTNESVMHFIRRQKFLYSKGIEKKDSEGVNSASQKDHGNDHPANSLFQSRRRGGLALKCLNVSETNVSWATLERLLQVCNLSCICIGRRRIDVDGPPDVYFEKNSGMSVKILGNRSDWETHCSLDSFISVDIHNSTTWGDGSVERILVRDFSGTKSPNKHLLPSPRKAGQQKTTPTKRKLGFPHVTKK